MLQRIKMVIVADKERGMVERKRIMVVNTISKLEATQ
jgi:hypothetical protein